MLQFLQFNITVYSCTKYVDSLCRYAFTIMHTMIMEYKFTSLIINIKFDTAHVLFV